MPLPPDDARWGDTRWGDTRWGDTRWGDTRWDDRRWAALRPDQAKRAPLYLGFADRIAAAVADGLLQPGEALPPERELAAQLDLSRTTVRRAIEELATRGLVTSRAGSGTYVATRFEQPLARLSGFTEDARARGLKPGNVWVERRIRAPLPEEALALALQRGDAVASLVRVRTAGGEPLAMERAVVPARILPRPEAVEDSLYAALGRHAPVRALQRLRAAAAEAADASRLGIPPGSPVMATVRHGYGTGGTPVEFTLAVHRGDRYDFVAEMRRE